jgi:hypothetical protein
VAQHERRDKGDDDDQSDQIDDVVHGISPLQPRLNNGSALALVPKAEIALTAQARELRS